MSLLVSSNKLKFRKNTSSAWQELLLQGKVDLLDQVYPVGSIYMSVNGTDPGTLFGGTWQRIQDCFLLAAGTTYAAGSTGGEAAHTLTVSEMPSHTHVLAFTNYGSLYGDYVGTGGAAKRTPAVQHPTDVANELKAANTGGGGSHNNMPPYLAVYVWQRAA